MPAYVQNALAALETANSYSLYKTRIAKGSIWFGRGYVSVVYLTHMPILLIIRLEIWKTTKIQIPYDPRAKILCEKTAVVRYLHLGQQQYKLSGLLFRIRQAEWRIGKLCDVEVEVICACKYQVRRYKKLRYNILDRLVLLGRMIGRRPCGRWTATIPFLDNI